MRRRAIDGHTVEALEFGGVREILASYASCELGKGAALKLYPSSDAKWIKGRLAETTELKGILEREIRLPLRGMRDIRLLLSQVHRKEPVLGPSELLQVCDTLRASKSLKDFFEKLELDVPYLRAIAGRLGEFDEIIESVERCIDTDKTVRDSASEKLREIRQRIEKLSAAIQEKFRAIISRPGMRSAVENENFVTRGGRPVIAVKANYRAQMEGVVLDRSNTGATLYIEPHALGELSNELEDELFAERKEVARILWELTRAVLDRQDEIVATVQLLGRVDLTYAKARLSIAYRMSGPEIGEGSALRLRGARHPLLMRLVLRQKRGVQLSEVMEEVVPIDVRLGEDFDLLILTGPNTGGKTVALKTIGLLALMAQSGMHIPARGDSRLPVFRQIYADIGDEQSIQQSLSTFSAHMLQVVRILARANRESLVLLDELGAGTDPVEGAALGTAILDNLLKAGARAVTTTHLGELKSYAYTTARAENGAVEFDLETLRPTYRLVIGEPGSSNALAIAQRLGMPKGVVGRANALLTKEARLGSDLINRVQSSRAATERRRLQAEALLEEAQKLKAAAHAALEQAEQERATAADEADHEIEKSMTEVRRLVSGFVAGMRNAPKVWCEKAAALGEQVAAAAAGTPLAVRHGRFIESVRKGDHVYVRQFKREGLVMRIHRKRQTMLLSVGKMQVEVPFAEIGELRE